MALIKEQDLQGLHITYETLPDQDFLLVTASGDYQPGFNEGLVGIMMPEIQKTDFTKFLFDFSHLRHQMSIIESFHRHKLFIKYTVPKDHKFAFIVNPAISTTDFHFIEIVFQNRGWALKIFTDLENAAHWLAT